MSLDNYANCNTDGNYIDDQAICKNCNQELYLHEDFERYSEKSICKHCGMKKCDNFEEIEYDDGDRAYDSWKDDQQEKGK